MGNLIPYIAVYFYIVFGAMAYGIFEKGASHWMWAMGILLTLIFYGVMVASGRFLLIGCIKVEELKRDNSNTKA